ncbi:MAG TPA: FGGY-family carbohydrate kinase [Chthonomonadaceae bacterium]|nr:FGGY-family carbohydrate kinase [Chthonomonadaceae bacterium]
MAAKAAFDDGAAMWLLLVYSSLHYRLAVRGLRTVQSAGSSVDWFQNAIGPGELLPGEDPWTALERVASLAPPGSRGLFFLPYLQGERSPIWDANARGVYFGFTSAHGRAELARSVMEGVAYALGTNLAVLEELGLAPERIRVLGRGMRYALWRRIFAAVYNRSLRLLERLSEATSCGAAMAAAVGLGLYPDYASAASAFAPLGEEEQPDPDAAVASSRASAFFRTLYPACADRFTALAEHLTQEHSVG